MENGNKHSNKHSNDEDVLRKRLLEIYDITHSYPAIVRALGDIVSSTHLQNFTAGRYEISPPTKRMILKQLEQIKDDDILKEIKRRGRPRRKKQK